MFMDQAIFVVEAKRTPLLPENSGPAPLSFPLDYLMAVVLRSIVDNGAWRPELISGVVMSMGGGIGGTGAKLRELILKEGYPKEWLTSGMADGGLSSIMAAIDWASWVSKERKEGAAVLAGGAESLSERLEWAGKVNNVVHKVGRKDGLLQKIALLGQLSFKELTQIGRDPKEFQEGEWQEQLAQELRISREEQDIWAHKSHLKAISAIGEGCFDNEITPVISGNMQHLITRDAGPRRDISVENLSKSPPYLTLSTMTEGNRAQSVSGCAVVLLATEAFVTQHQLTSPPLARIIGCVRVGISPNRSPLGSACVLSELLGRLKIPLDEIDSFEMDEASSLQLLSGIRFAQRPAKVGFVSLPYPLGAIPLEKINCWGGAIALGHVGVAQGPRMLTTLIHRLHRDQKHYGVVLVSQVGGESFGLLVERM